MDLKLRKRNPRQLFLKNVYPVSIPNFRSPFREIKFKNFLKNNVRIASTWMRTARRPCWPPRGQLCVTPEVNSRECTSRTHVPSENKTAHSGFETQRRYHQKYKTGVSVAPRKGRMSFKKNLKKESLIFRIVCLSLELSTLILSRSEKRIPFRTSRLSN